jgi:hypothetical protein
VHPDKRSLIDSPYIKIPVIACVVSGALAWTLRLLDLDSGGWQAVGIALWGISIALTPIYLYGFFVFERERRANSK